MVNNNSSGNQSKRGFDRVYGGKQTEQARELWTFSKVNFARIAEDMGAVGIRVEKPGEIGAAIEQRAQGQSPGGHRRGHRYRRAGAAGGDVSRQEEAPVSEDPYAILGVKREATQDEIRSAYRQLAKKLHPDLNPGDKQAEEKFKQVSVAYDLLGDPEKRGRFDRGEIDASGAERPRERYYRDFQGAGAEEHHYSSSGGFADFAEDDDFLAELLRRGGTGGGGRTRMRIRGQDMLYRLPVDFLEAVNGATKRITMPDGATLDVTIPAGTRDQQVLRLRGKGGPGIGGAPAGDALVTIDVEPHALFTRKDDDIHLDLPISLPEAVLGGKIDVPTPSGPVRMTVPKGANTGTVLRLRGKGAARGTAVTATNTSHSRSSCRRSPTPSSRSSRSAGRRDRAKSLANIWRF